jgi:hypothetical protein
LFYIVRGGKWVIPGRRRPRHDRSFTAKKICLAAPGSS